MEAGRNVKVEGKENNLLELIAADPAFNLTLEELPEDNGTFQIRRTGQRADRGISCKCGSADSGRTQRITGCQSGD